MPTKHEGFKDFVLDQLHDLRGVSCRAMFGGYGLSCRGMFFGIIHQGRLYFKVTPATVASYQTRDMKPFKATAKMTLKTYYEVPPDILEDGEALAAWAERACLLTQKATRSRTARDRRGP